MVNKVDLSSTKNELLLNLNRNWLSNRQGDHQANGLNLIKHEINQNFIKTQTEF